MFLCLRFLSLIIVLTSGDISPTINNSKSVLFSCIKKLNAFNKSIIPFSIEGFPAKPILNTLGEGNATLLGFKSIKWGIRIKFSSFTPLFTHILCR